MIYNYYVVRVVADLPKWYGGRPMVLFGFSGGSINLIPSHNLSGILLTAER